MHPFRQIGVPLDHSEQEIEMNADRQWVRNRAYGIWESEGRPADRADTHWLQAETELASDHAGAIADQTQEQAEGIPGGDLQGISSVKNNPADTVRTDKPLG
jgi:hypothetical protein